jgi:hypothetical protein
VSVVALATVLASSNATEKPSVRHKPNGDMGCSFLEATREAESLLRWFVDSSIRTRLRRDATRADDGSRPRTRLRHSMR